MENIVKNKTASQILKDAADFLEREDRWNKGGFFKPNKSNPEKGCSMCAHGAIMYCSDDEVKLRADNNEFTRGFAYTLTPHAPAAGPVAVLDAHRVGTYYQNLASRENLSLSEYLLKHYGEACVAHYNANLVGLKYEYNDNPNTTKQDVVNKLREAAQLSSEV